MNIFIKKLFITSVKMKQKIKNKKTILNIGENMDKIDSREDISYKKIIAMVDEELGLIELIEEHPCPCGSQWMIYQYQRTSPLIVSAWRDGNKHHFILKID